MDGRISGNPARPLGAGGFPTTPGRPVGRAGDAAGRGGVIPSGPPAAGAESFRAVLGDRLREAGPAPLPETEGLRFSGHARQRLTGRGIALSPEDLRSLEAGLDRARDKGARESLFLLRDFGFIVNVPNRTVVTALDTLELRERVFTNIDSTLILE